MSKIIDPRKIIIRKMAPGTREVPNPQWVQCPSSPSCCPIASNDKHHLENTSNEHSNANPREVEARRVRD